MPTTLDRILYTASVSVTGGRVGHARSNDGIIDFALSRPRATGGPGDATNPEQLFAAGYAACFQSALAVVGDRRNVNTSQSVVTCEVSLGPTDGRFGLSVVLTVHIPGLDDDLCRTLVDEAHQICPYSNATRGNIEVDVRA